MLGLETPRIAVLGTDCAIGKRTTCSLLLGAEVLAMALNGEGMTSMEADAVRSRLAEDLGVPVVLPPRDDPGRLVEIVRVWIGEGGTS